jgi:hypothetical protein
LRGTFQGFQGHWPDAEVIVISKDANWPERIEGKTLCDHRFFETEIKPFLEDFDRWLKVTSERHLDTSTPIHHPFLLPSFEEKWAHLRGKFSQGVRFHWKVRKFFKVIDQHDSLDSIVSRTCFTELLPIATVGRSSRNPIYFNLLRQSGKDHLAKLKQVIGSSRQKRIVFLAIGGVAVMKTLLDLERTETSSLFAGLDFKNGFATKIAPIVRVENHNSDVCEVWSTLHLSSNEGWTVVDRMVDKVTEFFSH